MNLNRIYTYWEGPEPDYIKLCYDTLKKNCGRDFEIYRYSDYKNPINFSSINHKTDWLKANLIYERGGFWIDADMITIKDFTPLVKLVEKHGFCGIPGFFGAKAGDPILKDWIDGMHKVLLNAGEAKFSELIHPLLKHKDFKEFGIFTKEMICPIYHTGDEFWHLFNNLKLEDFVTPNTFVVTLYNSQLSSDFKRLSRIEILSKDNEWLISKIFKHALK